jgi:hypothetical protein
MAKLQQISKVTKNGENADEEKRKIPLDVQKNMMDFFMRTSIPRKNKKSKNHLSTNEGDR